MTASAIYVGTVVHRRLKPKRHALRYRSFWLLVDIDELEALNGSSRLFSVNKRNVFSLHERDYGDRTGEPLRAYVERTLREAGQDCDGPIRLLTMPRILGYAFNPLSIYFCHRRDGSLAVICYEVSNTFGERHTYLIPVEGDGSVVRQSAQKNFYVSPFLDMALSYAFKVKPPEKSVTVAIQCADREGPILAAALTGERRAFSDRTLAALLLTHPFQTLKVIAGIHWEALFLWLKGIGLRDRPPPPERPVSAILQSSPQGQS